MNRTNLEHAAIAVIIQLALLALFFLLGQAPGDFFTLLAASLPGPFAFFGREHAQQERLLLKKGMSAGKACLEAFAFWSWDADSKLDFWCPVAAVSVVGMCCLLAGRIL